MTVDFGFELDEVVAVTPINDVGIIQVAAFDDGGIKYYVKSKGNSDWWPEMMLLRKQAV